MGFRIIEYNVDSSGSQWEAAAQLSQEVLERTTIGRLLERPYWLAEMLADRAHHSDPFATILVQGILDRFDSGSPSAPASQPQVE